MIYYISQKVKLKPNNKQASFFLRSAGVARFSYNWCLEHSRKMYERGEKTSAYGMVKVFNSIRKDEYPWSYDVSKWCSQMGIMNAFDAMKRWWSGVAQAPRFKKKGKSKDSFYLGPDSFSIQGKRLRISKLGWLRMTQSVYRKGEVKSVTISKANGEWFASFLLKVDSEQETYPHACQTQASVGLDLGLKDYLITSEGEKFEALQPFRKHERKLKRLQRRLSRKVKGSSGYARMRLKVQKYHTKIKNKRRDSIHKLTASLVERYRVLGIEDLNVKCMVKNRCLSKSLSDAAFGEFRRQLTYKAQLAGSCVVVADRWFPSTKLCSSCGFRLDKIGLGVREWQCPSCRASHDRDVNAARNLKNVAQRHWETLNADDRECKSLVLLGELERSCLTV